MELTCAICGQPIDIGEAKTLPPDVVQGIYYPESHLVWTPHEPGVIAYDGSGIEWEVLHTRCGKTIQSEAKRTP